MDFGDILDEWDRNTAKSAGKKAARSRRAAAESALAEMGSTELPRGGDSQPPPSVDPLSAWLRINGVRDKDAEESAARVSAADRRRRLRSKAPDASIDLHGLTREEAWIRLTAFFADAKRRGAEKVLIVHGKGNHSEGEAVLKRTTRDFVERCDFAGESGHADAKLGGTGATWAILKESEP